MHKQQNKLSDKTLLESTLFLSVSLFEDNQMTEHYLAPLNEQENEKKKTRERKVSEFQQQKQISQQIEQKANVSRLEIEIEKYSLKMIPIAGEIFIMIMGALLQGKDQEQKGRIMLTNYRILFFKKGKKLVDVPFGIISNISYHDKKMAVSLHLKYPHSWNFLILHLQKYENLHKFLPLYYKVSYLKNNFSFTYALKMSVIPERYFFDFKSQCDRLGFKQQENLFLCQNNNFNLCESYSKFIYSYRPQNQNSYFIVASHRKNQRFPIITYLYKNIHTKVKTSLWISSYYDETHKMNPNSQKEMLTCLKSNSQKMYVFAVGNIKGLEQSSVLKDIYVIFQKIGTNQEITYAQKQITEVFMYNKKRFIKEILNSKWYELISNLLEVSYNVAKKILNENTVLVKCEQGLDKSLQVSSLVQIILDPYYRTFKGFEALIMTNFVYYGHQFSKRFGQRDQGKGYCPIFLMFLDAVSQLINQNPFHFQFNSKYLSKIGQLMYTNIYGTFIANSLKEYLEFNVEEETISIWNDLKTNVSTNACYDKKYGVLEVWWDISEIKIWKQYFGNLVSKSKDHYGYFGAAEDNFDYQNLECLKIKRQNEDLQKKIQQQIKYIEELCQKKHKKSSK